MALRITCPGCKTALTFGDDKRGRKVRCSSCEKVLNIPAANGKKLPEDEEEGFQEGRKLKATAARADEEDEQEEEEEQPIKKKKKKKKKKSAMSGMLIGGVVGVLVRCLIESKKCYVVGVRQYFGELKAADLPTVIKGNQTARLDPQNLHFRELTTNRFLRNSPFRSDGALSPD